MEAERRERAAVPLLGVLLLLLCTGAVVPADVPVVTVNEGGSAELTCNYPSSVQSPRLEWKFSSGTDTGLVYYDNAFTANYKDRATIYPQGFRLTSVTRKDNGEYTCEVTAKDSNGNAVYYEYKTQLVVPVAPSVPVAQVPTSVSTSGVAMLQCIENDGSPRPTFTWYKNNVPMPSDPKSSPTFQNSSYTLDTTTGQLRFDPVMKGDAGEFYCEARNNLGVQKSAAVLMAVNDVNVGGIVAAVIVSLLILALIAFLVWFAYHKGYIGSKKNNKKVIYSQSSETRSDKNFQQTSSFLV